MNAEKEKALMDLARRNPFWVCFIVFLLLACNHGFGLVNLVRQRQNLDQTRYLQVQNLKDLDQARKLEDRLKALSIELLQIAKTNSAAKQIVQEFNIQWNPAAPAAVPVAQREDKSVGHN